jgi:hypothetical protein
MAAKRKQYSSEFKFKVVVESLQRDTFTVNGKPLSQAVLQGVKALLLVKEE